MGKGFVPLFGAYAKLDAGDVLANERRSMLQNKEISAAFSTKNPMFRASERVFLTPRSTKGLVVPLFRSPRVDASFLILTAIVDDIEFPFANPLQSRQSNG